MDTLRRHTRFALLLAAAWTVMITCHELGHLLGGWLGGATLIRYDLAPWRLPYSLHAPDPKPLLTLWAGPLFGVAAPLLLALCFRRTWAWLIADFCLVANGAYLALGWLSGDRHLDTPRLLDAGAHPLAVGVYCIVTLAIGYVRFRADCSRIFHASSTPARDEV